MKKVMWLLFLISVFIGKVSANEIYYSEYGEYSSFQEEKIVNSELVQVKEEERFLWYKENIIPKEYKIYQKNGNFLDDCYETEYSSWSKDYPIDLDGRTYEKREKYNYTIVNGVRYIHLTDLQGSYGSFRIPELQIFIDNKEANYKYTCTGCWKDFDKYIHNGNYEENLSYIDNGGQLIIDLGDIYPVNDVKLVFYIFDLGNSDKKYTLGYSIDKNIIYAKEPFVMHFADEYWVNAKRREHLIYELNIPITMWTTEVTSYELDTSPYVLSVETEEEYRYKEKWCRNYEKEKVYTSEYLSQQPIDYPNQSEYKKRYYQYQTRDKLEIVTPLKIDTDHYDLNNFVVYSSSDYDIEDNINWSKNGIYQITFDAGDIQVTKEVELDLSKNTISELQEEITRLQQQYDEEIQSLKEQLKYEKELNNNCIDANKKSINNIEKLKKLNEIYEKKIKELEKRIRKMNADIAIVLAEKNNQIQDYQSKIYETELSQNCQQESEFLKVVDELDRTKKESIKLKEKLNNYILQINGEEKISLLWLYLLIVIIFVSYIIIRIRKKSNQKKV